MATTETTTASAELLDQCCPMCGAAVSDRGRHCGACGEPVDSPTAPAPRATFDGWLVFLAVGAIVAPVLDLLEGTRLVLWSTEHVGSSVLRTAEGSVGMLLVGLSAYSLSVSIDFFLTKRAAPTLMTAVYLADVAATWLAVALAGACGRLAATTWNIDLALAGRSTLFAVVGIAYFRTSQRVKDTFVN